MEALLRLENVSVAYKTGGGLIKRARSFNAVDDVSLHIARGETLAVVGESGCGKSTLGRAILGLVPVASGQIIFNGTCVSGLSEKQMYGHRRRLQMIFQDSYASLDPRMKAVAAIAEPMRAFGLADASASAARAAKLMDVVGLGENLAGRRPHGLSGGQRQRIGIARALAAEPDLIVADEPVSALDVSIQAQILTLLGSVQRERGLAYLFISHDLRAVRYLADRVAVMYLGRIVETGPVKDVLESPQHPYTKALISAAPSIKKRTERIVLKGELPSLTDPPSGCRFHPRCPIAIDRCKEVDPRLTEISAGREAACIRLDGEQT